MKTATQGYADRRALIDIILTFGYLCLLRIRVCLTVFFIEGLRIGCRIVSKEALGGNQERTRKSIQKKP
jgi:hypothetical protein